MGLLHKLLFFFSCPVDNRTFEPRKGASNIDVGEFMNLTNSLSPQQRLAVFKFLSTG